MKLTSRGRYTLCAILDMANNLNGTPVRLKDISDRQNIPLNYLEQLFRKLRMNGIIKSVRGPGGGYVFNRELTEITVKNVIDSVEEESEEPTEPATTSEAQLVAAYFTEKDRVLLIALESDTLDKLLNKEPQ